MTSVLIEESGMTFALRPDAVAVVNDETARAHRLISG